MRRFLILGALLALLVTAAAAGASRSSGLKLTFGATPAQVGPGKAFTIRGSVRSLRRNRRRAAVTATLLSDTNATRLGVNVVKRLKAGRRKRFRLPVTIPTRGLSGGLYRLKVCARLSGRPARCKSRILEIAQPTTNPPVGSTPTPVTPAPTSTAVPEPTATATAGASATATQTATAGTTATPTATATATATPVGFTPGAETVGDILFPKLGNGGYDVINYALDLNYTPAAHMLSGSTTVTAVATQNLSRFSLDFVDDFTVSAVTVGGQAATFAAADGTKLRVTPPAGIPAGSTFVTKVTYSGIPPTITDEDGSNEGFLQTNDGAIVVCEPMGAMGWFPSNNHPSDKATTTMKMTVPAVPGYEVIGNGLLAMRATAGGFTTFTWVENKPMATYLATATQGPFQVSQSQSSKGVAIYDAVDPALSAAVTLQGNIAREGQALDFLSDTWGEYPFENAGGIVDNAIAQITYALETQTKPNYPLPPDVITVSHELAHQYFGDSLSIKQWQDIWLNEGFATYSEWLFGEKKNGGQTTKQHFDALYATAANDDFWKVPPAKPPTQSDVFGEPVYQRGSMTLEILRQIVGQATFDDIMRTWVSSHKYGVVTTADFIALAKAKSGKNLDAFFQDWLYDADKPTTLTVP